MWVSSAQYPPMLIISLHVNELNKLIGHFRVPLSIPFKASLSAICYGN